MDFIYTEEQRMLADSLRRLVDQAWTFPQRRARQAAGTLDSRAWGALAELGVLGLTISQDYGGFGEVPASLLPVHVELGRGLVSEPVIPSAVMGAALLDACGDAARGHWLPAIASGEAIVSVAYQEPGRRYDTQPQDCRAARTGQGWRLDGAKHLVWHGAAATAWLVSAKGAEGQTVLLAVPANAEGVRVTDTPTLDGARCARLDLNAVGLPADALLAEGADADAALTQALQWGTAALCAHAAGAIDRLLEITVDYLKTRKQFGQPLAAFQALQHRLAEMLVAKELALSMAYVAVAALTEPDAAQRRRMIASAKLEAARAGRQVAQMAVQLHGGMGMTDELEVGDYFKRLTMVDQLLGDTAEQLAVLEGLAILEEQA
ncbi:acyl-CoA dehydrogenase family protein [Achromobacter piechaudii]|uniref:Acyl-CoA dehydrogenase, C-terminal domain protein n=1 Tax=Achromobacter piechaudii ATCC 43553 TaxID=742159 RepID=D4X7U4_9BURK|nr:acyl-CoA dehydrogenase [Achromobacter piechaudii]EFF77040.1 acyl-CoA dehydrogenase, C-terminal domain protein [Achromobacter piechaudii ATCC 43553]